MADEIIAALIGAIIGSVGAAFASYWLSRRGEKRQAYEIVMQRYLVQLQDAVDSLWYRFYNLKDMGYREPSQRLADTYYLTTTLYALGKVLAFKHMIVGEGAYYNIEIVKPGLVDFLRDRFEDIEKKLNHLNYENQLKVNFFRYDRQALAETIIQRDGQNVRISTFLEFRKCYDDPNSQIKSILEPAREFILKLERPQFTELMSYLSQIAKKLESETGIKTNIKPEKTDVNKFKIN